MAAARDVRTARGRVRRRGCTRVARFIGLLMLSARSHGQTVGDNLREIQRLASPMRRPPFPFPALRRITRPTSCRSAEFARPLMRVFATKSVTYLLTCLLNQGHVAGQLAAYSFHASPR